MEHFLVASVEPEPIETLVGCLVSALRASWSMNKDVAKVVGLCSQFAASGKKDAFRGKSCLLSLHLQIFVNNICVLHPLSNAHSIDVCFLCRRTLARIRQDELRSLP